MEREVPALVIILGPSEEDADLISALLRSGALVVLATRREQVLQWIEGAVRETVLFRPATPSDALVQIDGLVLNVLEHRALWRGRVLPLSERELAILKALAQEPRRAWSFEELYKEVWSSSYLGDPSLVKVAIQRLRRKLRTAGVTIRIQSVPGYGYLPSTD